MAARFEANKVLKIWVLSDLFDGLLITKAELVLDNGGPDNLAFLAGRPMPELIF